MLQKHFIKSVSFNQCFHNSEAATRGVLCKKVFLEISQNSQENACARVAILINLIFKYVVLKEKKITETNERLILLFF